MPRKPREEDYRRLLEFRTGLRRFLRWSEEAAEKAGVTPSQHQLMLAIKGHGDARGPTIGDEPRCSRIDSSSARPTSAGQNARSTITMYVRVLRV